MQTINLTNPGQPPANGDKVKIIHDNGSIEIKTFFAVTPEPLSPIDAAVIISEKIEKLCNEKQQADFSFNGHNYYADKDAQEDFSKTRQRCEGMADSEHVPTPAPITGTWKTADKDEQNNNIFVPMTVGDLRSLANALYDRVAALWAIKGTHLSAIKSMVKSGATAEQILAYDYTIWW